MLSSPTTRRALAALALTTAVVSGPNRTTAAIVPSVEVFAGWESAYVSEGRDNLDGADLLSAAATVEAGGFAFATWYGSSHRADYRELNLSLERIFSLGPVELALGYTRLEYPRSDAAGDNEFSALLSLELPGGIAAEAGGRYATEAKGSFFELVLSHECTLRKDSVTLTPYVLAGVDAGYASAEFDGLNHVEAGLELAISLAGRLTVSGRLAHSHALRDMRDSGFDSVTWGGVGVSLGF